MFEHRGADEPRFTAKGGRALMRRLLMVSALAALMAAMMALMAAPAMANHNDLFDDEDRIIFFGDNDDDDCDFNGIFGNDDCDFNNLFGFGHDNDLNDLFDLDNNGFGN